MNILLIDDQGLIRESLALQIKLLDASFAVTSCGTLEEARKLVVDTRPDVIFLDVDMHGNQSAGLGFLDELKDADCESRIIMLSSQDDQTTVGKAIASGAVGFITKSAKDPTSMGRAMEIVLQGGVFLSDELRGRRTPPRVGGGTGPHGQTVRTVGPEELGITALRVYETLWHLSNGVKGYKNVANKMGISAGVAEEHARKGYERLSVAGKDGFLVMLSQKGWKLRAPTPTSA